MKLYRNPIGLIILLLLCMLPLSGAEDSPRIVAVGDVHGDWDGLVSILRQASILDPEGNWAGGSSIFIQTGDILDRGHRSREVMELLMRLEKQAKESGGRALSLIGNHEMMNMVGDLRYVSADEYAQYSGGASQKRREKAYKEFQKFWKRRAKVLKRGEPVFTEEMRETWETNHPPGFLEHRDAFSPAGKYGRWLRSLPAIVESDGIIFLHGGISSTLQQTSIAAVNERVRYEIELFDACKKYMVDQKVILPFFTLPEMLELARQELELRKLNGKEGKDLQPLVDFLGLENWITVSREGPLWFRGFDEWTDEEVAVHLPPLLSAFGNRRFVVGHSVQDKGTIRTRLEGQIILIDTGMLKTYYPDGRASALEIKNGMFTSIYTTGRTVLFSPEPKN